MNGNFDGRKHNSFDCSALVKGTVTINGEPSQAQKSGKITKGCYIIAINGQSTLNCTFQTTLQLIRKAVRPVIIKFSKGVVKNEDNNYIVSSPLIVLYILISFFLYFIFQSVDCKEEAKNDSIYSPNWLYLWNSYILDKENGFIYSIDINIEGIASHIASPNIITSYLLRRKSDGLENKKILFNLLIDRITNHSNNISYLSVQFHYINRIYLQTCRDNNYIISQFEKKYLEGSLESVFGDNSKYIICQNEILKEISFFY